MAVFSGMMQIKTKTEPPCADPGVTTVVHRPRVTDAIGNALRCAFTPDQALPDHLARPLTALDGSRWRD